MHRLANINTKIFVAWEKCQITREKGLAWQTESPLWYQLFDVGCLKNPNWQWLHHRNGELVDSNQSSGTPSELQKASAKKIA